MAQAGQGVAPKQPVWLAGLLALVVICAVGGVMAVKPQAPVSPKFSSQSASAVPSDPHCNDPAVLAFVVAAFDALQEFQSQPNLRLGTLSTVRQLDQVDLSSGPWRRIRSCTAVVQLRDGQRFASWHRILVPTASGPSIAAGYRVKVCFERHDPVHLGDCGEFVPPPDPHPELSHASLQTSKY